MRRLKGEAGRFLALATEDSTFFTPFTAGCSRSRSGSVELHSETPSNA